MTRSIGLLISLALSTACESAESAFCLAGPPAGTWELRAEDSRGGRLVVDVTFDSDSGVVRGNQFWAEGANEPLDFPIYASSWTPDSIKFTFAPAEIRVRAGCVAPDSFAVRVSRTPDGQESDPYIGTLRRVSAR